VNIIIVVLMVVIADHFLNADRMMRHLLNELSFILLVVEGR